MFLFLALPSKPSTALSACVCVHWGSHFVAAATSRGSFGEPGASAAQARGRRQQPAFPSHQFLVCLPRFACTPASRRPWWSPAAAPSTRSRYPPGQSTATTRKTPTGVSAGTPPRCVATNPSAQRGPACTWRPRSGWEKGSVAHAALTPQSTGAASRLDCV